MACHDTQNPGESVLWNPIGMDNVLMLANGVALIAAALGGAVAAIFVVYSGYLYISSSGDPQRMAQARGSLIGVAVGLTIIGGGFLIPTTISRFVIEPAGGVKIEVRQGVDCDGLLKGQLVFQRTASTPERMQFLVSRIQGQRSECGPEFWNPVVKTGAGYSRDCIEADPPEHKVGGVAVPDGLKDGASVNNTSSRDTGNNIIVFWAHPKDSSEPPNRGLPSDGSVCWLYVSAFSAWSEAYLLNTY